MLPLFPVSHPQMDTRTPEDLTEEELDDVYSSKTIEASKVSSSRGSDVDSRGNLPIDDR